ncbi:WD40-repeat-containing domain protein [Jimgerdemannia flammicorona]|uniref:WD40-repeat-containing domain protein n=1 Tax=Jimgerdemannia flammicorona TaxID=994334 RepID=A0A433PDN0_9FUNG|nr:WD40-repeat-containing domain protein [Jimgerdemannia flammicorona]
MYARRLGRLFCFAIEIAWIRRLTISMLPFTHSSSSTDRTGAQDARWAHWYVFVRRGASQFSMGGPITCLQFDELHVVSGSLDRSIWDLRTGSVFDYYSYEGGITSLQFDATRIVSAAGTNDVKIYNRTSFQHSSFSGHTQPITSVRFRDSVVASAGKDNVVKLWSL